MNEISSLTFCAHHFFRGYCGLGRQSEMKWPGRNTDLAVRHPSTPLLPNKRLSKITFIYTSSSTYTYRKCFCVVHIILPFIVFNEVEQWYVRHNYFTVLYHRLHVSTYIQVIFRPSFTGKSIKCYTCWDPIMLTEVKYIET